MGGRMARREIARSRRWKLSGTLGIVALAVLATAAIAGAVALGVANADRTAATASPKVATAPSAETTAADLLAATEATGTSELLVEVPDVTGRPLEEARQLLMLAGFSVVLNATPAGDSPTGTVLAQEPAAGAVLARGSEVILTHADPRAAAQSSTTATTKDPDTSVASARYVVCIDPGHQEHANTDPEPIGPGASKTKPKVTGGATGCTTKQHEHDLALAIALKLKSRLEARGITVVLTRTTNAVDISNAQRAQVANSANADLFVRIHADGNTNGDVRGLSTLYPAGNDWVGPISAKSLTAAKAVHKAVLSATGAVDRGVVDRADLSGFNYATVPSVLVECGFLSNPVEDKLLATAAYQDKLADGITRGIMAYLEQ